MSEPKMEDCDRSEQLELEDSIESMPPNPKHSGFVSASGDLPTRTINVLPFSSRRYANGHPSLEGIFMRKLRDNVTSTLTNITF